MKTQTKQGKHVGASWNWLPPKFENAQSTPNKAQPRKPDAVSHSPLPWSLSGQAGDQYIMARQPEGRIRVAEVFTLYDRELIVRAVNHASKLAEALEPLLHHPTLADVQRASKALAAYEAAQ